MKKTVERKMLAPDDHRTCPEVFCARNSGVGGGPMGPAPQVSVGDAELPPVMEGIIMPEPDGIMESDGMMAAAVIDGIMVIVVETMMDEVEVRSVGQPRRKSVVD